MHKADFERRTRALERSHQADMGSDEAARTRAFLEQLTDEELKRGLAISERYEAGITPTVEEQRFLDAMEAKYRTD